MAHALGYSIHSQTLLSPNTTMKALEEHSARPLSFYLSIYVAFSAAISIGGTAKYFYVYTGSIRASRILFDNLCFTILRTPLRWMDTVPLGRILNRFTADFNIVDSRLANDFSFGANNIFRLMGVIVAGYVHRILPRTSLLQLLTVSQHLCITLGYIPLRLASFHLCLDRQHLSARCQRGETSRVECQITCL
jgi:ABC-type multidrug transport system fused ATPase/permease subunit